MSTRNIVPNAHNEGSLGKETKYWNSVFATNLNNIPIISLVTKTMLVDAVNDLDIDSYLKIEEADTLFKEYLKLDEFRELHRTNTFSSQAPSSTVNELIDGVNKFSDIRKLQEDDPVNADVINTSLQALADRDVALLNRVELQDYFIYVNGNKGNDSTGDGTKEKPYKTIQKAIDVAGILNTQSQQNSYVTISIMAGPTYTAPTIKGKSIYLYSTSAISLSGTLTLDLNSTVTYNMPLTINSNSVGVRVSRNSTLLPQATLTVSSNSECINLTQGSFFETDYAVNLTSKNRQCINATDKSYIQINNVISCRSFLTSILLDRHCYMGVSGSVTVTSTNEKGIVVSKGSQLVLDNQLTCTAKSKAITVIANSQISMYSNSTNKFTHLVVSNEDMALYISSNSSFSTNRTITFSGASSEGTVNIELASIVSLNEAVIKSTNAGYGVFVTLGGTLTYYLLTYADCLMGNSYNNSGGRILTNR